jgi:type IV pilus assembly protein PilY1
MDKKNQWAAGSCTRPSFARTASLLLLAGVFLSPATLRADDIDIYTAAPSNADRPNVLLILDSSANWSSSLPATACRYKNNGVDSGVGPTDMSKKFGMEQCALHNVIDALPVSSSGTGSAGDALFNVGFMLLNESPASIAGGYPRKAIVPLTTANKTAIKNLIKSLDILADKGNNASLAKALYEGFLYFKGLAPYVGASGSKFDSQAFVDGRYNSPAASSCSKNYIILIGNGAPQSAENNDSKALLAGIGGNVAQITYPTSYVKASDQANWADEMARFMSGADVSSRDDQQNIITHAVAVTGAASDGLYPNFMRSIANWGLGQYHEASNPDALVSSLLTIFNSIQAVNSVFASASLPVAVNARGTYLNQVYMGMFRPDALAKPRWRGNLKQYKFALDSVGALSLVDSVNRNAINSGTGFIAPDAVSFWSASSSFWTNQPSGTPASVSDSPDGEVVEKGGAAQRLREKYASNQADRNVLTCVSCSEGTSLMGSTSTQFKDSNSAITTAMLGVTSSTVRTDMINWVRGADNRTGDELGPGGGVTIRPSVHGDVLHSRPVVINYGGSTGVVVFYGANDGMLHAINGNQTGSGAGENLWSFLPQEMFAKLNRIYGNSPEIRMPNTPAATPATPRDYFVDGPIGLYQKIEGGTTTKAIIYVTMRRGGRVLYALDVTNPSSPKYLWKKDQTDLVKLGQTWSEPKVIRIKGNDNPVLVFGAGYDANAEDSASPGTTTMGHAIYLLDAIEGGLLKEFSPMTRSVPADVTPVDSDYDGKIDRIYAVDLGGQVWRIDLENALGSGDKDYWGIYKLADLSGGSSSGRKFFFAPDAVVTKSFTALQFGSGDREKPLLGTNQDHLFSIFDKRPEKGTPTDFTATVFNQLLPVTDSSNTAGYGCYIALSTGEKSVNAATTFAGDSYFGTNRPTPPTANSCAANLGEAKGYKFPLFCIAPTSWVFPGGGLPPSPIAGIVRVEQNGKTKDVSFITGGNPGSPLAPIKPVPNIDKARTRTYWFTETQR